MAVAAAVGTMLAVAPAAARRGSIARGRATRPRAARSRPGGDQDVVAVVGLAVAVAAARRALKGRVVLVRDDAFGAVAELAHVLGLEARHLLLELWDGVVCAATDAGATERDLAAHACGGENRDDCNGGSPAVGSALSPAARVNGGLGVTNVWLVIF